MMVNSYAHRIILAGSVNDLVSIAVQVKEGPWIGEESKKLLRKLWNERKEYLMKRRKCSPHNKPENYEYREQQRGADHVYCTVCGEYVGRRSPNESEERETYE